MVHCEDQMGGRDRKSRVPPISCREVPSHQGVLGYYGRRIGHRFLPLNNLDLILEGFLWHHQFGSTVKSNLWKKC